MHESATALAAWESFYVIAGSSGGALIGLQLSVSLAMCGVAGLVYCAVVIRRARRQTDYIPVLEDWIFYAALPCCTYAALTVTAIVLRSAPQPALFAIAASALTLLLIGIHNAWDAIMHIVVSNAGNDH